MFDYVSLASDGAIVLAVGLAVQALWSIKKVLNGAIESGIPLSILPLQDFPVIPVQLAPGTDHHLALPPAPESDRVRPPREELDPDEVDMRGKVACHMMDDSGRVYHETLHFKKRRRPRQVRRTRGVYLVSSQNEQGEFVYRRVLK